jgi:hypothetical protein
MRLAEVGAGPLLLLAVACGGPAPAVTPAPPAPAPRSEPRPFAALYRLDCCGQRGLLATVRGDGERLSISVAAGPAGTVTEAWLAGAEGVVRSGPRRCTDGVGPGTVALPGGSAIPADPRLAAFLLSGNVPAGARPSDAWSGWLTATLGGLTAEWLVDRGSVSAVEVAAAGGHGPMLEATFDDHHGRVPGRIVFRAGGDAGELRLVEWREAALPAAPAWVSWPRCGAPQ